jgi:dienelactone hydrolase
MAIIVAKLPMALSASATRKPPTRGDHGERESAKMTTVEGETMGLRRLSLAACAAALFLLGAPAAVADPAPARTCTRQVGTVQQPNPRAKQDAFAWNDAFNSLKVRFFSQTCADLAGTLFWPRPMPASGQLPGVLVFPPSGGIADQRQVAYIARFLASNGYIVLSADPQGLGDSGVFSDPACGTNPGYSMPSPCPGVPFQSTDNWMEMARSALDFFVSSGNPLIDRLDTAHIGATGHSLGARVSSYLQDSRFDEGRPYLPARIAATVGLDNISSNYYGDTSAGGGNTAANKLIVGQPNPTKSLPIRITVPGLGLASDNTTNKDPELKKFAFAQWRHAGVPSGMLVFSGVVHDDFSQSAQSDEVMLHRFADYTLAWFDLWLKGDQTAVDRLLLRTVEGEPVSQLLSATMRSAFYLPSRGFNCDDWRTGC